MTSEVDVYIGDNTPTYYDKVSHFNMLCYLNMHDYYENVVILFENGGKRRMECFNTMFVH